MADKEIQVMISEV